MNVSLDALETDPYPIYAHLRRHEPISFMAPLGLWFATRWDDVVRIDSDPEDFSAAVEPSAINRTLGPTMMHAEGKDHRSIHDVVVPGLRATHGSVAAPFIEAGVSRLIDAIAGRGSADLVEAFAEPLAVRILARVLGLPESLEERLRAWFDAFAAGGANFTADPVVQTRADAASASFDQALAPTVAGAVEASPGSVLAHILAARDEGHPITDAQILANLKLMVLGGMQEPRDLIGSAVWALLTHPDQLTLIRNGSVPLKRALEEVLRWQSPVGTITRQVRRGVELEGVALESGARLAAVLASANRDERRWSDPDRFDVTRAEGPNIAFAQGSHACIGSALARLEARIAVEALLTRLPDLRLDPARPATMKGWEFRGPLQLPVVWAA